MPHTITLSTGRASPAASSSASFRLTSGVHFSGTGTSRAARAGTARRAANAIAWIVRFKFLTGRHYTRRTMTGTTYTDGSYLESTGGTWHLEDSPAKARWIVEMLKRHSEVQPATVCEVGCGAGGILHELERQMPEHVTFTGYEISPQAHQLSQRFANDRCRFVLGDAFADSQVYDLVLIMDVIEHVEDCFAFMRQLKRKGRWKLYNIPLDTSASFTLR